MSTELRNVPNCKTQNELTQTRFWGGEDRMTFIQVTQGPAKDVSDQFFNHLQLTKEQAGNLAIELMLFAEGREVTDLDEFIDSELAN